VYGAGWCGFLHAAILDIVKILAFDSVQVGSRGVSNISSQRCPEPLFTLAASIAGDQIAMKLLRNK
jgi:hypothetical protein